LEVQALKLTSTTTSAGNWRFRPTMKRQPWALWSIRAHEDQRDQVIAAGDSRQDTERLMIEVMVAHIAMLQQEGLPVPEPSEAASVTILDPAAA
jgi:predicted RNase H-like HicB family nuclease